MSRGNVQTKRPIQFKTRVTPFKASAACSSCWSRLIDCRPRLHGALAKLIIGAICTEQEQTLHVSPQPPSDFTPLSDSHNAEKRDREIHVISGLAFGMWRAGLLVVTRESCVHAGSP